MQRVGYFMSQQEQDELIGKTVRELKEKTDQLNTHKAKANDLGRQLGVFAEALKTHPENVQFEGLHHNEPSRGLPISPRLLDFQALAGLCEQIRTLRAEVQNLESEKKRLGF